MEFNEFIKGPNKASTFIFVLEDIKRDENTQKFIEKARQFTYTKITRDNYERKIKNSLFNYLDKNKLLIDPNFDERIVLDGSCKGIDLKEVSSFLLKSDLSESILKMSKLKCTLTI
nr:hypothetical protein [Methanobrevibacter arboriphilus]